MPIVGTSLLINSAHSVQLEICLVGLAVVVLYFTSVRLLLGGSPPKATILPQWDPPEGLSPAAVRHISRMGPLEDSKAVASALIDAAVKGVIEIRKDGNYIIARKAGGTVELSPEEAALLEVLPDPGDSIELTRVNGTARAAAKTFDKSLKLQFGKGYFSTRPGWAAIGVLLSWLVLVMLFATVPDTGAEASGAFFQLWLLGWTGFLTGFVVWAIGLWRDVHSKATRRSAILLTAFLTPFVALEIWALAKLVIHHDYIPAAAVVVFACVTTILIRRLRAYTKTGRAAMDKIEGLRLYMRDARQGLASRTPELFEKLLPYAIALNVEYEWSESFADVLAKTQPGNTYQPSWHTGPAFDASNMEAFASWVGDSLSSAIANSISTGT